MGQCIAIACTDPELRRCYPIIRQLRPHLSALEFLGQVKRQRAHGYQVVFLEAGQKVRAVAGYRVTECLAWGKFLYVDDLVTREEDRSRGYGQVLFDWLVAEAARLDCSELHLDSGVHRFGAHRFYLARRMDITCHHFARKLTRVEATNSRGRRKARGG